MCLAASIFCCGDFPGAQSMSLWSGAGQRLVGFGVGIDVTVDVFLGADSAFSLVICGWPITGFLIVVLSASSG